MIRLLFVPIIAPLAVKAYYDIHSGHGNPTLKKYCIKDLLSK